MRTLMFAQQIISTLALTCDQVSNFYQTTKHAEGQGVGCCSEDGSTALEVGSSCVADKTRVEDTRHALWEGASKSRVYMDAADYGLKIAVDKSLEGTFTRFYANSGVIAPGVTDGPMEGQRPGLGYGNLRWATVVAYNDDFTKGGLLWNGNSSYGNMEILGRSEKTLPDVFNTPSAPYRMYELYPNLAGAPYWNCSKSAVSDALRYGRDDMFGVEAITFKDTNGLEMVGIMPDDLQWGVAFETHGPMYYDKMIDATWVELRNDFDAYLNVVWSTYHPVFGGAANGKCFVEDYGSQAEFEAYTFKTRTEDYCHHKNPTLCVEWCYAIRHGDHDFSIVKPNGDLVWNVTAQAFGFTTTKAYDSVMLRRIPPVFVDIPSSA